MALDPTSDVILTPWQNRDFRPAEYEAALTTCLQQFQELQQSLQVLMQAAPQSEERAPDTPLNGMIRHTKSTWNSTVDANALYARENGAWTRIATRYEEGTWTPTLQGVTGTPTYPTQIGRYTRIGNRVLFNLRLDVTKGAATWSETEVNLPLSIDSNDRGTVALHTNRIGSSGKVLQTLKIDNGTNSVRIQQADQGTGPTVALTNTGFSTSTCIIRMSGNYMTDA